ncbi:helix-turn-helix domain-containing protein [Ruminococcus sp.]|uniref:helix-turn-helix domain-containing protein n=1 Tax=uncultured Ruminococcus sp. TaxID=165186 RepID=UPI0026664F7E|nr:helix-turn-helix domain-containing protein [uncultured Ruminococcus sp.]
MDKSKEIFSEYSDIVTVDEVMKMLRLGKNTVYKLLKDGEIMNVKVGARYIIPKQSVIEFVSTTNRKS